MTLFNLNKYLILVVLMISSISSGEDLIYESVLPSSPSPVFVSLAVGDKHLDFMALHLSTNTVALDSKHQSLLGESLGQQMNVNAAGEVEHLFTYRPPKLVEIGEAALNVNAISIIDLSKLYTFSGFSFDGYLGVGPLMDYRIELFYSEEKLRIRRGPVSEITGFKHVPVKFVMDLPVVEVEILGVMEHFFLDSGGNTDIAFNEKTFARLVSANVLKEEEIPIGMSSEKGRVNVRAGRIQALKLLDRKLNETLVSSTQGSQNKLGTSFLMGLDSVLDLPGRRFWYRPIKNYRPSLDVEMMLGMRLIYYKGSVVAIAMKDGGAVQAAGMSQYDRLDRLGDLKKGSFNLVSLQAACQKHEGKEVEIEYYQHASNMMIRTKIKMPSAVFSPNISRE